MWVRVEPGLPPGVAAVTTSVWQYEDVMQIGVMRGSFLRPPILWAQVLTAGMRNVRRAPGLLTELQQLLVSPTVYAEADLTEPRNQALLRFLGFIEQPAQYERKLYLRSI